MPQILYTASIWLLISSFILVVVCSGSVENRAASPSAPRRPPFNGSIFGKRSSSPPKVVYGGQFSEQQPQQDNDHHQYKTQEALNALLYLRHQQESLLRTAINQCLFQQQHQEQNLIDETDLQQVINAICNNVVGRHAAAERLGQKEVAANWLDQV